MTRTDLLDSARAVADAVLYEGYLLYPYRASAAKNRVRWQFGVVGPVGAGDAGCGEEPEMSTDCLVDLQDETTVDIRVRFLQLQSRTVWRLEATPGRGASFTPVPELTCGSRTWLSWDEAVQREVDLAARHIPDLLGEVLTLPVEVEGDTETELLHDEDGVLVGKVVRRRWPLSAGLQVHARRVGEAVVVGLRLDNQHQWSPEEPDGMPRSHRDQALQYSLLSAHLVLSVHHGQFLSVIDPPDWAARAAAECASHRCWPVLIGAQGDRDVVLASPIILYDWPEIAAESAGALFDSTEVDELLTLRIKTMTDGEKREARATDDHAGAILDRCESMPDEVLERMHGATRDVSIRDEVPMWSTLENDGTPPGDPRPWWDPVVDSSVSPETDSVVVAGTAVAAGSSVRLRPSRRADAQDLFFAGQVAVVTGVHHDVDGRIHVAVVLRDDPAGDLHQWYGRYLYFGPEEIVPVEAGGAA